MEVENQKPKWFTSKKFLFSIVSVLILLIVGLAFAYYFAILKGENINTAKTGEASIIYTEPSVGIETKQMSDYEGMTSENSYDFTVTGRADDTANLNYAVYLEEESGNTVDKSKVKYYLTDANDVPIFLATSRPKDDMNLLITSDGQEKYYSHVKDVTIKNSDNVEVFSTQLINDDSDNYLLQYYAENVLNLTSDDTFNVEQDGLCFQVNYNSTDNTTDIDYNTILESSNCSISYAENYDEETGALSYVLANISDSSVLYSAVFSDSYMQFADDSRFEGDVVSYIANQLGVSDGNSFYVKKAYTVLNESSEVEILSSYCTKQTVNGSSYSNEAVEDSYCTDAYTIVVGQPLVFTVGELDSNYSETYPSLTNIITANSISFKKGQVVFPDFVKENYFQKRELNPTKTYKLRYWINASENVDSSGDVGEEVTPTTDGNSHEVIFGQSGVFKFRVNVYAKQS